MSGEKRFSGRVALVTGAAGNIGLATARRLAEDGADIVLLDIAADKLAEAKDAVATFGTRVETATCDVTDFASVDAAVARAEELLGPVALLFNNAGYQGAFTPIQDYSPEDFAKVIQIDLIGAFHVLRAVSARMVAHGFGRIVNTASMAGLQGPPNMGAYAAAKFGIVGLTQTASKDLAPHNIRVNGIAPALMGPGFMWDRQVELQAKAGTQYFSSDPEEVSKAMIGSVPMRRLGDISEIPGVVSFLMGEDSSYMTGVTLPISGGIL
ncbi:xylitol dehydrogenase [Neoasaia chiangmaiensis NBRC 101099]|uniref:Oxidoreductase n=1 Tax=Neoasaia chiangmaiensis TaxID=320497 RepID=A0A1U9KMX5_9PROT|nr:SDR family NAD(P)-dependent oxidoreductase [Neoasaia chiangmaiensis]AQS87139.1 oxidoreductase [Neoasaia chiangmaiensis]GBR38153.1 xylitol dehydrogenase [Neoasaia chiangmaiensis NBRC 101099]GEN16018.1 3-oxoacyl-ACP reductase [Neoasaia chiangmaiensis]